MAGDALNSPQRPTFNFDAHASAFPLFQNAYLPTLWFQLEDMFQLIVTPKGIEKVMIQLKDTPSKVYAIGAELFYQRCP